MVKRANNSHLDQNNEGFPGNPMVLEQANANRRLTVMPNTNSKNDC